jgi:hypothetical protein
MLYRSSVTLEETDFGTQLETLNKRIKQVQRLLLSHRAYAVKKRRAEHSAHCTTVCTQLQDKDQWSTCVRECSEVPPTMASIEQMADKFPVDVQRLRTDAQLAGLFKRFQLRPDQIEATPQEAELISHILAMPIATVGLSEEAWHHALGVLKREEFEPQLHDLILRWGRRKDDYDEASKEELARKLARHDTHGVLSTAVEKLEAAK